MMLNESVSLLVFGVSPAFRPLATSVEGLEKFGPIVRDTYQ